MFSDHAVFLVIFYVSREVRIPMQRNILILTHTIFTILNNMIVSLPSYYNQRCDIGMIYIFFPFMNTITQIHIHQPLHIFSRRYCYCRR